MEISKAFEYLIRDRNIPQDIFKDFLNQTIESWNKEQNFNYEIELQKIISKNADKFLFLGPSYKFKTKKVRVSKIISLHNFARYYLNNKVYIGFAERELARYTHEISRNTEHFASLVDTVTSRCKSSA